MNMGKTDLEHCVDLVRMAQRQTPAKVDYDALADLIRAIGHLAEHVRKYVSDQPTAHPELLNAAVNKLHETSETLAGRISALEALAFTRQSAEPDFSPGLRDTFDWISEDCRKNELQALDAFVAWKLGLQALIEAWRHGARFDHEETGD